MLVSGLLSLAGLLSAPLADMQVRNIGIIGYAVVAPVAFLLIDIVFGRTQPALRSEARARRDVKADASGRQPSALPM